MKHSFIQDRIVLLDPKMILVNRDARQRKIFTTDDLEASISILGLIHPIIVRDMGNGLPVLIAGERRLTAVRNLELPKVPVRFATRDLTDAEVSLIELEENIRRQDLSWQENCLAMLGIHKAYSEMDPEWTYEATSKATGQTYIGVWRRIKIAEALESGNVKLEDAPSWEKAYRILEAQWERQRETAMTELESEIIDTMSTEEAVKVITSVVQDASPDATITDAAAPIPPSAPLPSGDDTPIILGDFMEFAKTYSGPAFNLLHCDFPYGLEHDQSDQGDRSFSNHKYDDSTDLYWSLLEVLSTNLDRLVSSSAHIIFWHAWKFHVETREYFAAKMPSLWVQDVPLIWHKSDNRGIMADAQRRPRNTTEVALLISRGDRKLISALANSYAAPTSKVIHQSEKPIPVLNHFLQMVVDENTRLLDPTSGSGNALISADTCGAGRVLGIEKDPEYHARSAAAWTRYKKLERISNVK